MTQYSEALIEKVAWAMREASELTMGETRPLAVAALDTLGLRAVTECDMGSGWRGCSVNYCDNPKRTRYVTEWKAS